MTARSRQPFRWAAALLALSCAIASPRAAAQQAPQAQPAQEPQVSDDSRYALEAILQRLRAESRESREEAATQLRRLEPGDVPAIRQRLLSSLGISHLNVHAAMVRAIRQITGGRENAEYDLLQALLSYPSRSPDIDVATERVALATALGAIQTADSGRALVAFGLAHNRIFRLASIRVGKNSLKLYVVPALIEIRRPTEDQRMYVRAMREAIRCVTPGQSVQTRDNALLAEILRAWGSVRQQDAMVVIASYVNSDRVQVRDAARWAIAQFGRDALNTLRNVYETFVGEDPNPLWGAERVSRELYAAYDRRKSDEVRAALDAGLAAARDGRNDEMLSRFEWVLARHPLFERRTEMVEPLVRYARQLERTDVARAAVLYRMALRVDPDGARASSIRGAILYLEAERALARGVADPELYRAAVNADPTHARARSQFEAVAQVEVLRARQRRRTIGAVGLLAVAAASAGVLYNESKKREKKKKKAAPAPNAERTAAESGAIESAGEASVSVTDEASTTASSIASEAPAATDAATVSHTNTADVTASPTASSEPEAVREARAVASDSSSASSGDPPASASADRTANDAQTLEDPKPAATATSSREPGLVDLLVSVASAPPKKKSKRR
jgi:hypothetical protein